MFVAPPLSLAGRNRFFGITGRWNRLRLRVLNRQVAHLSRVVLHPTYRGAGIAADFVRRSCELCPSPWIETLAEMGRINPFFEKAGFVRVPGGEPAPVATRSRRDQSRLYGGRHRHGAKALVSQETFEKSRYSRPAYFVFDNRRPAAGRRGTDVG